MTEQKYVTVNLVEDSQWSCSTLLRAMRIVSMMVTEKFTTVSFSDRDDEKTLYITYKGYVTSLTVFSQDFKKLPFDFKDEREFKRKFEKLLSDLLSPFLWKDEKGDVSTILVKKKESTPARYGQYNVTLVLVVDGGTKDDAKSIIEELSQGICDTHLAYSATSYYAC